MYEHQRQVDQENIGIRAFKVKQAKAVERAVDRLRHGLGDSWSGLTPDEIEELEWLFGELWAYVARTEWDDLQFGHLGMGDVVRLLTLGSQLRRHARSSIEILRDAEELILAKSPFDTRLTTEQLIDEYGIEEGKQA